MRLLVTNTQYPQAYAVIRALRPHAQRVVATMEGESRLGARLAHAANSRLVDARYYAPSPAGDWWAGRVGPENTPQEEAFVAAIERVCERERVDVIYPTWDPHVYVLAKNKERLARLGALVPVPDYDIVLTALDKHRTIEAARATGFPHPRTVLHRDETDLRAVAAEFGFPLVLKPRFTSGGRGMAIVKTGDELERALPAVVARHDHPLIQEYIPGGERGSVQFVLDRGGGLAFVFRKERTRKLRVTARYGTVSESALPGEGVAAMARLIGATGWWGALGVETIVDPRDGVHKLMEINPRYPRQLWNRTELGINEPLMCVRAARGEHLDPVPGYPLGVLFVSPVEDLQLLLYQLVDRLVFLARTGPLRHNPVDRLSPPPTIARQVRSFAGTYTGAKARVFDPYFRYFLQDPLVSLIWWLQFTTWIAGGVKHLGR
jgi:glutathione synthase/RimK-type ligase-like ATP-grasp enzyme